MTSSPQEDWPVVAREEVEDFMRRCMESVGTCPSHSRILAKSVTTSDYRGHYSHGLNRLEKYVNDIKAGIVMKEGEPEVLKETAATAWVTGNNINGHVVGTYCMELAIKKAKEVGIGWIVAKDSNHFGIAGYYGMMASQKGLIGMAYTTTSPYVVPTRGRERAIGTNPICVAAPAKETENDFVLDMATCTVAQGKLEIAMRKGESIPEGWACDSSGKITTDASDGISTGGLMPLGGAEINGGYKGYGLAMMVELFCSILGGGPFGKDTPKWNQTNQPYDYAQCFVAIDPDKFASGFDDRMDKFADMCRAVDKAEGEEEVLIPGDPERKQMELCQSLGGIPYHPNQIAHAIMLAERLGVRPMKTL